MVLDSRILNRDVMLKSYFFALIEKIYIKWKIWIDHCNLCGGMLDMWHVREDEAVSFGC